jgi:hypothetical protein
MMYVSNLPGLGSFITVDSATENAILHINAQGQDWWCASAGKGYESANPFFVLRLVGYALTEQPHLLEEVTEVVAKAIGAVSTLKWLSRLDIQFQPKITVRI